jgi:hypothetical protein
MQNGNQVGFSKWLVHLFFPVHRARAGRNKESPRGALIRNVKSDLEKKLSSQINVLTASLSPSKRNQQPNSDDFVTNEPPSPEIASPLTAVQREWRAAPLTGGTVQMRSRDSFNQREETTKGHLFQRRKSTRTQR